MSTPTKVYAVLSIQDLRLMINHIKAHSRPHINGGKKDFGPCTGVFRTVVSEKIDQDGDRQLDSYQLSRHILVKGRDAFVGDMPEPLDFDTFRHQRNAQMGDAVRESLKGDEPEPTCPNCSRPVGLCDCGHYQ